MNPFIYEEKSSHFTIKNYCMWIWIRKRTSMKHSQTPSQMENDFLGKKIFMKKHKRDSKVIFVNGFPNLDKAQKIEKGEGC